MLVGQLAADRAAAQHRQPAGQLTQQTDECQQAGI
jgi:hypothetical protein